jgi:hypothetical protein
VTTFGKTEEFSKEFARLLKKWRSLNGDLELLKQVLAANPRGHEPIIVRVSGLGTKTEIYKVKHFRCLAMKGKGSLSGIRIVYAFLPDQKRIEFIEIYYKEKDDIDCDKERIKRYYK